MNFYTHLAKQGKPENIVLATIIKTRGSTPQVSGASAIFSANGLVHGTIGGGILENTITKMAIEAVSTGKSELVEFNLDGKITDESGSICGGGATVLLDADPSKHNVAFAKLKEDLAENKAGLLITIIKTQKNDEISIDREWLAEGDGVPADLKEDLLPGKIKELLTRRKTLLLRQKSATGENTIFMEPVLPEKRLLIIGGGHIGKALCHLAGLIGFDVTIIDNRPEIKDHSHFPEAHEVIIGDIENILQNTLIDSNTYIVIVTQGHKHDATALRQCIGRGAAYIGMIGSQRKIRLVKDSFIKNRWATKEELDEIHAPIGLDIGSETVEEIAVSIAAELIKESKTRTRMKTKKGVSIIILAAGTSRRMGEPKMLMPYEKSTIIETVAEKALLSKADHIVVVTGGYGPEIRNRLNRFAVDVIVNRDYEAGMLSSVQAGIRALPPGTRAAMIMLGDQPMIETEVIDHLIRVYNNHAHRLVIPVYNGKRGHPLLVDLSFRDAIETLDPQVGLRQLILDNPEEVLETEVDTPAILKDIDTKKDYMDIINGG